MQSILNCNHLMGGGYISLFPTARLLMGRCLMYDVYNNELERLNDSLEQGMDTLQRLFYSLYKFPTPYYEVAFYRSSGTATDTVKVRFHGKGIRD